MKRQNYIESWYDSEILPDQNWNTEIKNSLESANIILLLISGNFIVSDYCYDIEMKEALKRQEIGDAIVIAVILRDFDWKETPFAKLQVLPKNGITIDD